jgi:hypothetical protein
MHNEELHNLYSLLSIIRMVKSGGRSGRGMGEMESSYKIFLGKPEGKIPDVDWRTVDPLK